MTVLNSFRLMINDLMHVMTPLLLMTNDFSNLQRLSVVTNAETL